MKTLIALYKLLRQEINNSKKLDIIMANIKDIQSKEAELQASVDTMQAQVGQLISQKEDVILALNQHIADLQALVDASPSSEQLQAVVDSLQATKDDVESTVATTTDTTTETTTESTTDTTTV